MSNRQTSTEGLVTGLFCDPFAAAEAIRDLTRMGFPEQDIDLIGVLGGRAPQMDTLLSSMGLPAGQAASLDEEFEDGAIVLVIRISSSRRAQPAVNVLRHHGCILPTECVGDGERRSA
jgi:hypothetical protein